MRVNIDFETRSEIDLKKVGPYTYASHPSTTIMCACYSIDGGPVQTWVMGQPQPSDLCKAIAMEAEFHAWNAQFERVIWDNFSEWLQVPPPEAWHCSMVLAGLHGLPLSLAQAALALRLDATKDMEGNRIMMQMTKPRGRDSEGNPIWWDEPAKWQKLVAYCKRDVEVEMAIAEYLCPMPAREREIYLLDQTVNGRGVRLDVELARASREVAEISTRRSDALLDELTGGAAKKITKVADLTNWVRAQGVDVDGLDKQVVRDLQAGDIPADVSAALTLRAEGAKSSVAKLNSMLAYAGSGDRLRGLLQYAGAATGRWAGRGAQPQNFPQGEVPDVERYIPWVLARDVDAIDMFYPPMVVVSSLLRAHLIASLGRRLMAGDFNAIEARVLAWLAGETRLLQLFRDKKDPYKDMAAKVYSVSIDAVTKDQRKMGKQAILGLGYQMGKKTFAETCWKYNMHVEEEFAADVVAIYRDANPAIKNLWYELDRAAVEAVSSRKEVEAAGGRVVFDGTDPDWLKMWLPSGRCLYYSRPRIQEHLTPWGANQRIVVSDTVDSRTRKWGPRKMYGGLWTENAVQAIARDLLAEAMLRLEEEGYPVVLTVHDEVVADVPVGHGTVPAFEEIMRILPSWAAGCPVEVEAWEGARYRK